MTRNKVDDKLLHWDEIKNQKWPALLLGNGFSVNIWQDFNYHSLYDLAKSDEIDFPLIESAIELFEKKDTTNFENILNLLLGALLANDVIEGGQDKKLKRLYRKVQKALISTVQGSHVPSDTINTEYISEEFSKYKTIFTTNYDLIPYWSIMNHNTNKFRDYFWNTNNSFDPENTDLWTNCTRILYLHGALHILEEIDGGNSWKNTANESNLLEQFPDTFNSTYRPLFITEGDSREKLSKIYGSDYLRFSYHELLNHNKPIVILGHSLEPDFDQHLIDAISEWGKRRVAISVWPEMESHDIIQFKARINKHLKMHNLSFFDSTTHPLGSTELTVG